jgi:hypothetical protein
MASVPQSDEGTEMKCTLEVPRVTDWDLRKKQEGRRERVKTKKGRKYIIYR